MKWSIAAVAALTLLGASCSRERANERSAIAASARAFAHEFAARAPLVEASPGAFAAHGALNTTIARGGLRMIVDGCAVTITPVGTVATTGRLDDGAVVFADVAPESDAVFVAEEGAVEELRVLRSKRAATTFRWSISPTPRLRNGVVEVVDGSGRVCVRSAPLYAIDANGTRRDLRVVLDGATLVAELDAHDLTYPVVVDPRWVSGGALVESRVNFAMVRLASGEVMIAAGQGQYSPNPRRTATEIYNPTTKAWRLGAPIPETRTTPAALTLASGKVLVVGGWGASSALSSAVLYDPTADSWSPAPPMTVTRGEPVIAALPGGKALVFGDSKTASDLYDPTSGFTAAGAMSEGRRLAATTTLADGRVLVAGGYGSATALSSVEVYSPTAGTWTSVAAMPTARASAVAATLADGRAIVIGGSGSTGVLSTVEIYDPSSNTWSSTTPITWPRYEHTVTVLGTGKVLVAAGRDWNGDFNDSRLFDPTTSTWTTYSLAVTRSGHRAALLADGRVFVAGGYGTAGGTAEIFAALPSGAPCTSPFDCDSSQCIDGVCCKTSCSGSCSACDVSGSVGTCSPVSSGDPHGSRSCSGYACTAGTCATSCTDDTQCASSRFCRAGVCEPSQTNGQTCTRARECASGACADGRCCNTSCTSQCAACDVVGREGTCSPVTGAPHGARTACSTTPTTCGLVCDGADPVACHIASTSVVCSATACASGVETHASTCNGSGACSDTPKSCGAYACGTTACKTTCDSAADCAAGHYCKGGSCTMLEGLGTACTVGSTCATGFCTDGVCCAENSCGVGRSCATSKKGTCAKTNAALCSNEAECGSGNCVDGVCCESKCEGPCEACDVSGQIGRCVPVSGAPHNARPACAKGEADACAGRKCDGVDGSKCAAFVANEVSCRARSCADGSVTTAATCDGSGACPAPTKSSCEGFACRSDAPECRTSCATHDECAAGFACNAGRCVPATARCSDDGAAAIGADGKPSSCAPFQCSEGKCRERCEASGECVAGYVCDGAKCVAAASTGDEGGCGFGGGSARGGAFAGLLLFATMMTRRRSRW